MHSSLGRRIGILAAGSLVIAGLGAAGASAAEPKNTSTITGSANWYTQAYDSFPSGGYLTPRQDDTTGPQRAPFGTSSHRMTIGESSAQTELYRTDALDGVPVANLTRLEYSELARSTVGGSSRQAAYLRLSVDTNADGHTDDSLFFYPANNGTVTDGQWQTWDVSAGTIDVNGDNGGTTTLAAYAAAHPGATLVNDKFDPAHDAGALALIAGGALGGDTDPQTNGEYFLDRVVVGVSGQDTLYDLGGGSEVSGGSTALTVDPAHDQGWKKQAYDNNVYLTPDQSFVDGPATPPAGGGSLRFTLNSTENPDRVELFRTTQYDNTLVRDLRNISYSTYVHADAGNVTPQQPAYLRLSLDNDGNGTLDDTLYFYPANNGTVQQDKWQTWNAGNGLWSLNGDQGAGAAVTLADYVVAHPDATIIPNGDVTAPTQPRGGVAFLVGGGGASQMNGSYYIDDLHLATVDAATGHTITGKAFDLEPTPPTFSVGDAAVSEGNSGATLTFPVTLSRPFATATSVHYATSDGTATTAGGDYVGKSGTLTIPAGSTAGSIQVHVLSDRIRETDEYLQLTLSSPSGATIADGMAVGRIINDDTGVGLAARQGILHRIRASVTSVPAAAGAAVKVFRVTSSGPKQVFFGHLNSSGRISALMRATYSRGTHVVLYATVRTANGVYRSQTVTVLVR